MQMSPEHALPHRPWSGGAIPTPAHHILAQLEGPPLSYAQQNFLCSIRHCWQPTEQARSQASLADHGHGCGGAQYASREASFWDRGHGKNEQVSSLHQQTLKLAGLEANYEQVAMSARQDHIALLREQHCEP